MIAQPNGSMVSGQAGMNELHQGFYKLGQNVSSMEQTLDNLSTDLKDNNGSNQNYYTVPPVSQYPSSQQWQNYPGNPQSIPPNYLPYPYNLYYPYQYPNQTAPVQPNQIGPYESGQPGQFGQYGPNVNDRNQPNQPGQDQLNRQQTTDSQSNNSMGSMNSSQMNHSTQSGGFLNGNVLKLAFTFILVISLILGIVSVVGFISSLFKDNKSAQPGTNN